MSVGVANRETQRRAAPATPATVARCAAKAPRWLPGLVGGLAGLAALVGGVALLAWLIGPRASPPAPATTPVRVVPPPEDIQSEPPPSDQRPRPMPTAPTPTPSLPELDLPPLQDALALPGVDGATVVPTNWSPSEAVVPSMPAPTPVSGSGDAPARRLVTPDLSADYPRRARRRGIEGRSEVRLQVGADGRVQAVDVLHSEPAGIFEDAARRAARRLRYDPAIADGRPVVSAVEETFVWSLR